MRKFTHAITILTLLALFSGCAREQIVQAAEETRTDAEESPRQQLVLSVTQAEEDQPWIYFAPEDLGGKANTSITYWQLSEVNIRVDGVDLPLADAIRSEAFTAAELFALARVDAGNGFCQETFSSERGLTHFLYSYPEYELELAYDVYETPDGQQHLIDEISICATSDQQHSLSHFYVDEESPWGYFLDREDWGLNFRISNITPTQIILDYTQKGGQQIGELSVQSCLLYAGDTQPLTYIGTYDIVEQSLLLSRNTSGQVTIDWSSVADTLAPGKYALCLVVADLYDASNVHPLMINYTDQQSFFVAFSI